MTLEKGKHIYFASDFHLGVPDDETSLSREKSIVRWLDHIAPSAQEIFLVGDLFDFWFEYKRVIPKGFVRLQGKIAELTDAGIPIHVFTGNHDMWIFDYLPRELGVSLYRKPIERTWNDKRFFIGHGDGLGPGDHGYKFIKRVFENRVCQWLFARIHPNFGLWLANYSSRSSRASTGQTDDHFKGKEGEWLIQFCESELKSNPVDYFVFGHRHLPIEYAFANESTYFNLGDWINYTTFLQFDGTACHLKQWNGNEAVYYK